FVWRNGAYHFERDEADADPHAYFLMLDANVALAGGDWSRALRLAGEAIASPIPTTGQWPQEPYPDRIASYTVLEAMLAHAERGERNDVVALLAQLEGNLTRPDNPYVD